jgi:hypothetical protein
MPVSRPICKTTDGQIDALYLRVRAGVRGIDERHRTDRPQLAAALEFAARGMYWSFTVSTDWRDPYASF